ncbi:M20 metallopeptidase family protein [Paenarthrobacter nitroguajacolicus]|uniref:M20 metallopeptidase family protein n=1 Tax=Paenarthrobacter nitroguajacolicus TaxID=211146 RepID=UPI00248AFD60|nr:M20 family metallopeptidase [Paenarthrobacter nitroguajacolicus]MDI2036464.1 N-acetylcysteine deacetylase [Paenarthrobacter nitroguajacolicus]
MTNTTPTDAVPFSALSLLEGASAAIPSFESDLVDFRREMHAEPEVGLHLPRTQARVLEAIKELNLEITLGQAASSVVAVLRGGATQSALGSRSTVLLRGDMDALPVAEQTGLSFASTNGAMHACGHDLHTAGLIGAARLLSSVRDSLTGDVIFMFQPGEEGHDGARIMLEEGALSAAGRRPDAAYALHVVSDMPAGLFTTRAGSYMAAFGDLSVKVLGRGGHGSRPYQALDPIQVAAEMLGALQTYITKRFNVFDPVVLSVGQFHGGSASNVIPDSAEFSASVRSFSPGVEARLAQELPDFIRQLATAHQLTAEARFTPIMPATINHESDAELWSQTARNFYGDHRFIQSHNPRTGSDDFSRLLVEVPGAYGHLGAGSLDVDPAEWAPMHSPRATFDDSILVDQAQFMAGVALGKLQELEFLG